MAEPGPPLVSGQARTACIKLQRLHTYLVNASLTASLLLHSRFMHTTSIMRDAKTGTAERLEALELDDWRLDGKLDL